MLNRTVLKKNTSYSFLQTIYLMLYFKEIVFVWFSSKVLYSFIKFKKIIVSCFAFFFYECYVHSPVIGNLICGVLWLPLTFLCASFIIKFYVDIIWVDYSYFYPMDLFKVRLNFSIAYFFSPHIFWMIYFSVCAFALHHINHNC